MVLAPGAHRRPAVSVEATLAALGDPTRVGVIGLLRQGPARPGELAEALGVKPNALSRHLRLLREAGLVHERLDEADRRGHVLALNPAPLLELADWATEATRLWTDQLDAFADFVARQERS